MKKIILFILFLSLVWETKCQTVSVTWGPDLFKPKKTDISMMIGSDASSFYCLRTLSSFFNGYEYTIEK